MTDVKAVTAGAAAVAVSARAKAGKTVVRVTNSVPAAPAKSVDRAKKGRLAKSGRPVRTGWHATSVAHVRSARRAAMAAVMGSAHRGPRS